MQRERIFTSLMSIYMGIVVVGVWGSSLLNFFQGNNMLFNAVWIQANTTSYVINIAIFLMVVTLISAKAPIGFMRSWSLITPVETLAYSLINIVLLLLTILRYLPDDLKNKILSESQFIGPVNNFYNLILIIPLVLLIVVTSRRAGGASAE